MAGEKEYIIEVAGQEIRVPAWASQSTMLKISSELTQMSKVDKMMLNNLKEYSKRVGKLVKQIDDTQEQQIYNSEQDTRTTKKITKQTESLGQKVIGASSFLGSTEAPITSLIGAAKKGGPAIQKGLMKVLGPLFGAATGTADQMAAASRRLSGTSEVITDALFLWAGWNAGKLEAFAKVQQQMIDNGVVMFESAAAFRELRRSVNASGVTYDAFAKTIAANNAAITQFGGTTSLGANEFKRFFKRMEKAADDVGDYGLSNTELLQQTGEFLEYQRLTGGLLATTEGLQNDLATSFDALQIETAALASISGLTRTQAMQALISIDNPDFAVGIRALEGDTKKAAMAVRDNLALINSVTGSEGPLGALSNAVALTLATAQGDTSQINIRSAMAANQVDITALQRMFGDNVLDRLQTAIVGGDEAAVDKFFYDIISKEPERFSTAAGVLFNDLEKTQHALNRSLVDLNNTFSNVTEDTMQKAREDARKALTEAGTSTKVLNDAAKVFLQMQNAITLPMDKFAGVLEIASSGVNRAVQYLAGNQAERDAIDAEDQAATELSPTAETDVPKYIETTNGRGQRREIINPEWQAIQDEYRENNNIVDARPTGPRLDTHRRRWDEQYGDTHNHNGTPKAQYFGGPVQANNPYLIGDGVDMRQAELFVPEVNGRILNNRELQDLVTGKLTETQNNSIIDNNLEREYLEIIETKKKTLATLQNLKRYAKNKMNDDKLNQARDASGA